MLSGALLVSLLLVCSDSWADGLMPRPLIRFGGPAKTEEQAAPPIIVPKPMSLPRGTGRVERVASVTPPLPSVPSIATTNSAVGAMPTPKSSAVSKAAPIELSDSDDLFVVRSNKEPALPEVAVPASESGEEPVAATSIVQPVSYSSEGETLEDAWNAALSVSRSLSAKDYERLGAEATVEAARGVALPKLSNMTGVHTISKELAFQTEVPLSQLVPTLPDITHESPICETDFATSTTALTIPIYMGGRVLNMIEAAQAASCTLGADRQISEQDLKYEVAQTYFLVLRIRCLYQVALEAEQTIAAHEKDARRLLDNGIVTKNVLLAAEVAHANAKQDLIKAENAVNLSQAAYNRLLWRSFDTPVKIVDVDIPPLSGDVDALTRTAVARRPELAALSHKSRALAAKSRVYRAGRLPQVAAIGTYDYLENSHLNENSFFTGSLGVEWTPFDGGVSRNRQSAAEYEAMSVTREYEEAESKIRLQVYQCWQDEQETRHRVKTAEKGVERAEENLRVVNRGFKEGLIGHTEVLDAQTMRTQAQSNLANARYDAILATYHLQRAVGQL
ncbi:MAG: TolC family protein [Thermoguttaceae bacterium]